MRLSKYFLRGLLVLIPVVVTGYVFYAVLFALNEAVLTPIGSKIPIDTPESVDWAIGSLVAVMLITLVGLLTSNFLGRRFVSMIEDLVEKLPLIKLLYGSVRDVLGAFVGDKKSFDHPVLVSLSSDGHAKILGFVTRESMSFLGIEGHVAVYLPQSYNFAGNVLILPRSAVEPVSASSSDVMTFLVSGGVSGRE